MNFQLDRLLQNRISRRSILVGAGALTGLGIVQYSLKGVAQTRFSDYPFKLGVASGDPLPDGVVLWTRLAPDPLNGGGMPAIQVPVQWQVSTDPEMRQIVLRGTTIAIPELAHSVRVEVKGLQPNRWYWYQFKVANEFSPVGRTKTAPVPGTPINQLKFAFASCQDYQNGFYSAYKNMAEEDLDFVVFLGDYIYEYGPEAGGPRQHIGPEVFTLTDYRNRYAQYRLDPHLQAAHANFPWIVTWDDHEVENNYANLVPEETSGQFNDRLAFVTRRANAYQAYYEHMPLRGSSAPLGPDMQLYRRFTFGDLAEFNVLDTRQYRTDQPCGDGLKPLCPEALNPSATLTGTQQEQWLFQGLSQSQAIWNVIAQQVIFARIDFDPRPEPFNVFNVDQWDGYVAARKRITDFLQQQQPANPIIITGDIHSSWVSDIKANFNNSASETVATEFVGTSITSDFPTQFINPVLQALPANPHIKYFNGAKRGYVRCTVTRQSWRSDYRFVNSILDPNSPVVTGASFQVEKGIPGAQLIL